MVLKRKNKIKVGFQGEAGAYSEEASYKYFGNKIETIGYEKLADVFRAVEKGEVDYGVVPVENSIEGTVRKGYELFLEYDVKPIAEVILRIEHCLIAFPGANLESIKFVYSHPQALGQCSKFLEKYKYKVIPFYNTAGSVKMIKEKKLKHAAGIASEMAGKIYGMKILKKGIENNPQNFTRFLVIAKSGRTSPTSHDKTSLIFTLKHIPGSLFRALNVFAERDINLTKIESFPIPGKPWEYNFLLDFEGHIDDKKIISALEELKKQTTFLRIIGSYPKANFIKTKKVLQKIDIGLDKIAIIGAGGNMGQWFCQFFKERGIEVIASDINKNSLKKLKENLGVKIVNDNKEAVKFAKFILISVLPQNFEEVVKEIAPHIRKDQIILDITSLKEKPVKIMHKYFKNNLVLGTHPLWGPASKENLKMILTPTNKKERNFVEKFKKWLEAEGIKVILMSSQKQDNLMSLVSGLSHFVALVSGSTLEKDFKKIKDVYGSSFEILSLLIKRVISNSPYLFSELQFSFPKMREIEDNFEKKVKFWREIIKNEDRKKFIQEMLKIKRSIKSLI
jgi:prephenate dehydratase/prephenate dehydrogenase